MPAVTAMCSVRVLHVRCARAGRLPVDVHRGRIWQSGLVASMGDFSPTPTEQDLKVASVTKLAGVVQGRQQVYRVRWRERADGGSAWVSRERRVPGLEAAQQLRREVAAKYEGGLAITPDRTSLAEAGDLWLRHYATQPRRRAGSGGKRVERSSWDEAARTVQYVVDELGADTPFASVTPSDLFRLVEGRRNLRTGAPVSDGTKERMVGVLKAWFEDAVDFGWHQHNVATRLASSDGSTCTHPDPDRWRPSDLLWFLAYTGCSWSEAAGLRSSDDRGDHLQLVQVWPREADEPRSYGKASARVPRDIPVISRLRPVLERLEMAPHYYGGQAVIEGVMMRGADRWAVAVRRPDGDIWLECHPTSDLPTRGRG
jgi:hypothetical protein